MTATELTKLENAVALLQQGRAADCRDELIEILHANNAAAPMPPGWVVRRDEAAKASG